MNTTIALTISPVNRIGYHKHFSNPSLSVYVDDKYFIQEVMAKSRIDTYIIYPEFDIKGRLHYHGTVELDINQKCRFYKYTQAKLTSLGFVDFKILATDKDKTRWNEYIIKEWPFTSQVLEIKDPMTKELHHKRIIYIKELETKQYNLLDFFPIKEQQAETEDVEI